MRQPRELGRLVVLDQLDGVDVGIDELLSNSSRSPSATTAAV
ncbi:MAG TPA: hypothetical protein VFY45_16200 [Baekduia sp.]|nr:hypothetical protein [Baekduia sp.]